jgi:lipopolysaccharide transport system permease protein
MKVLLRNRNLIRQLTKREIAARYKGSYFGTLWTVLVPLFMMVVYTFVFSEIFNGRWSIESTNKAEFALIIFCGMSVFNFFSDCIARAPGTIVSNPNYVKKVVFPLEILTVVNSLSALVLLLINIIILTLGLLLFTGTIPLSIIYLPLVVFPLFLLSIGLGWMLSSLGVYIRDINHFVNIIISALMFLSPIFYSLDNVPEKYRIIYRLNPLTYCVEDMRSIFIWGEQPDWLWLGVSLIVDLAIFILGYLWFKKTKRGFSDVL